MSDTHPEHKTTDIHVLNRADGNELYRHGYTNGGETSQVAVQNGMLFSRIDEMYSQNSAAYVSLALDGTEQWRILARPDVQIHPAVDGEFVFVSTWEGLIGLDAATGQTIWTAPQLSALNGAFVLIDEVIYVGTSETPAIYAIRAKDGTVLKSIATSTSGSQVVGITNGVLIARSGGSLREFANPSGKAENRELRAET